METKTDLQKQIQNELLAFSLVNDIYHSEEDWKRINELRALRAMGTIIATKGVFPMHISEEPIEMNFEQLRIRYSILSKIQRDILAKDFRCTITRKFMSLDFIKELESLGYTVVDFGHYYEIFSMLDRLKKEKEENQKIPTPNDLYEKTLVGARNMFKKVVIDLALAGQFTVNLRVNNTPIEFLQRIKDCGYEVVGNDGVCYKISWLHAKEDKNMPLLSGEDENMPRPNDLYQTSLFNLRNGFAKNVTKLSLEGEFESTLICSSTPMEFVEELKAKGYKKTGDDGVGLKFSWLHAKKETLTSPLPEKRVIEKVD